MRTHLTTTISAVPVAALLGSLAAAHPVTARDKPYRATAEPLAVPATPKDDAGSLQAAFNFADGRWINPEDRLELRLSRRLAAGRERVAVQIGTIDWTALFTVTGEALTYRAGPVPLPPGDTRLAAYLVVNDWDWREIGNWPLRVLTPAGFERSEISPKLDLLNQGQLAEAHAPASAAPPRRTFQEINANIGIRTLHARSGVTLSSTINLLGVSHRPSALRFADRGAAAPRLDLADYFVTLEAPGVKVALGHQSFTLQRHLVAAFASRGIGATAKRGAFDVTLAALNGKAIVGFSNLFGLDARSNQLLVFGLGAELVPARPGTARVEGTLTHGSLQPRSNVSQGAVTDAEKSQGLGFRFVGAFKQRLRIDAGLAESRFTNPSDPMLNQGRTLVSVARRRDSARYLDASYDVLKAAKLSASLPVTLTGTYRHERVDPLYHSIAASAVRPDVLLHTWEMNGLIGPAITQVSYSRSHDNLSRIASLLTTLTTMATTTTTVPLGTLMNASKPPLWLPTVNYTLNRVGQLGKRPSASGGFRDPAQVPNQMNTVQTVRAEWGHSIWRTAIGANRSFQDNRQAGRETADVVTNTEQLSLGLTPVRALLTSFDLGFERTDNRELRRVARTLRTGANVNWRLTRTTTLDSILARTSLRESTQRTTSTDVTVQLTQTIALRSAGTKKPQAQLFARVFRQSGDLLDLVLISDQQHRNWSINTGITISLF